MALCIFVQNRNGNLYVPYLYENDDKVMLNWHWLDNDWNDNNPAARFASLFISLPSIRCLVEFSFSVVLASHQAYDRLHQSVLKVLGISCSRGT